MQLQPGTVFSLTFLVMVSAGCSSSPAPSVLSPKQPHSNVNRAGDVLGGDQVVDTILNAETVEVFRLEHREFAENLSDYEAIEGPFPVGETDSRELADAVTAYDSYERGMKVGCIPIMHMRTRFVRAESTVDVVYCFDCSLLSVFHNEKLAGGGLFVPAEARLVRLAKRLLPNDEAVQGLE